MNWLRKLRTRFRALFQKRRLDAEMDEEMRAHLEMQAQENLAAGMSPEEARYAALRQFGQVDWFKEAAREQRGVAWVESLGMDVRFGFRQLLKHKGSSLLAVLILALGIGGTTAVFSVADKVLLNPIPGRGRLITVSEVRVIDGFHWHASPPLVQELAFHSNLVESLTYYVQGPQEKKVQVDEKTVKLRGAKVAPNFFALLGVRPLAGRTFLSGEGAEEADAVIVISYGLWQQHFGGARDAIGKSIKLDGTAYTIVGIMPRNVQFPFGPGESQFWIPYVFTAKELAGPWEPEDAEWPVIGRMQKGAAIKELQTVLDTVAARWLLDRHQPNERWRFQVDPWRNDPTLEKTLWSLQAMVGALLLIACANVGNLLLSRALTRRGEFGIRIAIGAGRLRLARQLLVESLSLAGLAAALGVFFAWGGIVGLEQFYLSQLARVNVIGLDWTVLAITCLVSAVAGVLFGVAPAWLAARIDVNQWLKETAQQYSGGFLQRLFHEGFVVIQVSLAVVLLAGAGMMIHSVLKLLWVNPGLNPKGLYSVSYNPNPVTTFKSDFEGAKRSGLSLKEAGREAARRQVRLWVNWQELMLEKLQAIPGIEAAAVGCDLGGRIPCQVEGRTDSVILAKGVISVRTGDYFRTVGVPLIAGRWLTKEDCVPGQQTIVINERLASACWPGQNPLGKKLSSPPPPPGTRVEPERIVVGVVKNIIYWRKDQEVEPAYYEPYERLAPEGETGLFFNIGVYIFRSRLEPDVLRKSLTRLGQEMSPAVEIRNVRSIEAQLYASTAPRRVLMWLLITLGGLGLLLSALGVYAVMACSLAHRTREVGIRMALGASRSQIRQLFLRHGLRLTVNGLALGVVVAITAAHYVESLFFGVTPADPWVFSGILVILGVAAGVACWLPARRAARTNPMDALRYE